MSDHKQGQVRFGSADARVVCDAWREEARAEWERTGRWKRLVGGCFVSSSKDPDDWEHPYLK